MVYPVRSRKRNQAVPNGVLPVKRTVNNQKVLCRQSCKRLAISLCNQIILFMVFDRRHQTELALDPLCVVVSDI